MDRNLEMMICMKEQNFIINLKDGQIYFPLENMIIIYNILNKEYSQLH